MKNITRHLIAGSLLCLSLGATAQNADLARAEEIVAHAGFGFMKLYASLNSVAFYKLNGYQSLGEAILPLNRDVSVKCELMRKYLD